MKKVKPPIISEEMLRSFGLYIAWWSPLEKEFVKCISGLMGASIYKTLIMTNYMQWKAKKDLLTRLINTSAAPQEKKDKFLDLVNKADNFSNIRRYIAHYVWTHDKEREGAFIPSFLTIDKDKIIHSTNDNSQRRKKFSYTPDELEQEVAKMVLLYDELTDFIKDQGFEPILDEDVEDSAE